MPDYTGKIYKVLIGETEYEILDQGARDLIAALGDAVYWIGVTTTALTDGATTNPITVGGETVQAKVGGMAQYSGEEFVYNGTAWQSIGKNNFGDFAFVNSGDVTGTAAAQTFTGSQATITSTLSGGEAQTVVTGIGSDTTATIKEFDGAGSVTAGSAASFTQGTDSFTQGTDTLTQMVTNGVLQISFSQGSDTFTQGSDSFTANTPTAVTLPTSKETSVVTASGTATTGSITVPTTGTATYTPAGTNDTSSVVGTATPHTAS